MISAVTIIIIRRNIYDICVLGKLSFQWGITSVNYRLSHVLIICYHENVCIYIFHAHNTYIFPCLIAELVWGTEVCNKMRAMC